MSKFSPNQAKPPKSGRKKGVPNKRTLILNEILDAGGLDVPQMLLALLPKLPITKQADVLLDLMSFLYPKRKAIEFDDSHSVSTQGFKISFVKPSRP